MCTKTVIFTTVSLYRLKMNMDL